MDPEMTCGGTIRSVWVVLALGAGSADLLPAQEEAVGLIVDTFCADLDGGTGGVSVDNDGVVYVADFGSILSDPETMGTRVFRITSDGDAEVFASGLKGASGNEFDSEGNLFQSNIRGNFISKIAPDGTWSEFARDGIEGPVGIVIDEDDVLFVANCHGNTVRRVTPAGGSSVFAQDPLLKCPNGITMDEDHNLYVANFDNGDVLKIARDGGVSRLATVPGGNNGHLVYHQGSLYVVARGSHRIYRVTLAGEIEVFAGTGKRGRDDGPALEATFSYPNDIDVGPDGSFYVNEIAATNGPHTNLAPMVVRRIRAAP